MEKLTTDNVQLWVDDTLFQCDECETWIDLGRIVKDGECWECGESYTLYISKD
ncbi:hypothetical protein SAMN05421858_5075 [Haladaptatus litoreus]|uniref:Uncharacterized protein n=1 Tax=Haladaptatus litoreus TaxID=553468 RepID=A0A1N7FHR8_9EURY|nr:hypothetical protein SAMN05421858_5075 [Haladaptatus litoreus]